MQAGHAQSLLAVCGQPQGFYLVDRLSGATVAEATPEQRLFDMTALGLSDGEHSLELFYIDEWGTPSKRGKSIASFKLGAGSGKQSLAAASFLRVRSAAGGYIQLRFNVTLEGSYALPVEFEVMDINQPSATIASISLERRNVVSELIGPFPNGQIVQLALTASDGVAEGLRGVAVVTDPVLIDSESPAAAQAIPAAPDCCCD